MVEYVYEIGLVLLGAFVTLWPPAKKGTKIICLSGFVSLALLAGYRTSQQRQPPTLSEISDAVKQQFPITTMVTSAAPEFVEAGGHIYLYERTPQTWRNHANYQGHLRLDESTALLTTVGEEQPFNPQPSAPAGMTITDLAVFLEFPDEIQVISRPMEWLPTEGLTNPSNVAYLLILQSLSPGLIGTSARRDSFHIKATKAGTFQPKYFIGGGSHGAFVRFAPTSFSITAEP